MSSESTNPYSAPQSAPDVPVESKGGSRLPPLNALRLAGAMTLVTIAWIAFWANVIHQLLYGVMIMVICLNMLPKLLDPHGLRRKGGFRSLLFTLFIIGLINLMAWVLIGNGLPLMAKTLLKHPMVFVLGWLISCGFLLWGWWQRRNNPPFQPKPHAELPSASPWRPLPRAQDL